MRKTSVVALCLCLGFASSAWANGRDAKFANGLVERGYFDLAEVEFRRMISAPSADQESQRAGKLGLARVNGYAAFRESDPKAKLEKFKSAEEEFQEFISDKQDPQYFLATFELGSLLQEKAKAIARIIDLDLVARTGYENAEDLREEASEALNNAQSLFDDLTVFLNSQSNRTATQQADLEKASYYQATNYYYLGLLYPKGTFERESNFKRATEQLEDFIWEYESRPIALVALMFKGKSHVEISLENKSEAELGEALDSFSGLEVIGTSPDSLEQLQDRFEWSIYESTLALNAWQKSTETVEKVDFMLAAFEEHGPRLRLGQYAFLAIIEKANAYFNMGDTDLALDSARKVAEEAKGTVAGRRANDMIKRLLSGGGADGVSDPKVLMAGGEAHYASRDYAKAVHSFRQAILAFEAQEEADRDTSLASHAWNRLGDCLKRLGRNLESGLAFSAGRDRYKEPFETFKDNSFRAYSSFQSFSKRAPDEGKTAAARLSETAKNFILATFQDDVGDIIYFEAKDDFEEENFTGAKEKFFRVDVTTRHYETSQLYIGRCDLETAYKTIERDAGAVSATARQQVQTGIKTLNDYRAWTKTYPAPDPARAAARAQALAASEYYESEAYWAIKDYDSMLKTLTGFDTRWSTQPNLIPPALYNRIRAYVAKVDLDSADQWADHMYENYAKSGSTIQSLALVGQAHSDQEKKAEEAGDEATALIHRKKSADFLYKWLQATGAKFEEAMTVGIKFYELKDYETAIKVFKANFDRYKNNPKYKGTKKLFNNKLVLARCYLATQKFHEGEPLFEQMKKEKGETKDLLTGMAKCYGGWVEEVDGQFAEFDGTARYPDAVAIYNRFVNTSEPGSDLWWLGKFGQIYMLYKADQKDRARKLMKNITLLYQSPFGPEDIDKRMKWLERVLNQ